MCAQKVAQKGKWPIYPPCSDASKLRKHCQVAERPIDFPAVFGILSDRDSKLAKVYIRIYDLPADKHIITIFFSKVVIYQYFDKFQVHGDYEIN